MKAEFQKHEKICQVYSIPKSCLYFAIIVAVTYAIVMITINTWAVETPTYMGHPFMDAYVVDTPGCKMPYLNPWDPIALPYISVKEPVICGIPLILSNQTSLWINEQLLATLNYGETLRCCYESFNRKVAEKDDGSKQDLKIRMSGNCIPFVKSSNIYDEFVEVTCRINKTVVYTDYHAFIIRKRPDEVIRRLNPRQKPSVIIIGVDSVSKANSIRQFPRTLKLIQEEDAIEFLGYNKVGDNTFPNVMPLFTGHSVEELQETCWKKNSDKFDNCHFVWSDFEEAGYLTAFAEDTCWMGLFLYLKHGFFKQPTDYYTQAYMKLNEGKIGRLHKGNANLCAGNRLALDVLFDYTQKLASNLTKENLPFFGHFWGTSLTHDSLNVPVQGDEIYEKLFSDFKKNGVLNNSIVIFMSDHGLRFGSFRSTYQGRLEDRLPFIYMLLPNWFKEKYTTSVENLRNNTRKLVTAFDFHATLKDLTDISQLTNEALKQRLPHANQRGLSLFMPIPEERSCETAGINEEWCTCYESHKVTVYHSLAVIAGNAIVDKLNKELKESNQCSKLQLNKILSAREEFSPMEERFTNTKKLQMMVSVTPGGGQFEGIVMYETDKKIAEDTGKIGRLNAYGNTSYCVYDSVLRLYCYLL